MSIVLILKRNMISLSILNSKGYQYTGKCEVLKNKKGLFVVMKWQKISNKLYVLLGSTIISKLSSLFLLLLFHIVLLLWVKLVLMIILQILCPTLPIAKFKHCLNLDDIHC